MDTVEAAEGEGELLFKADRAIGLTGRCTIDVAAADIEEDVAAAIS